MRDKITIGVFLGILIVFLIGQLITKDRSYSNMESKSLITLSDFSIGEILNGDNSDILEAYLTDQILFKDSLVKTRNDSLDKMNITNINGVYIGKDGYLIKNFSKPGKELEDNIYEMKEFIKKQTVPCTFLMVPNSSYIYRDKLPKGADIYSQGLVIDKIQEGIGGSVNFIDATDILEEHKDENIYFKTDQNWTMDGAYYGYEALCKGLGIEVTPKENLVKAIGSDEFLGTLYSLAPISKQEKDELIIYTNSNGEYKVDYIDKGTRSMSLMEYDYLKIKDKYKTFLCGNHSVVRISSNGLIDENVLIIKDSYANCLIPLLADNFNEIHVMDLRYYTDNIDEYIEKNNIDRVIFIYNVDFFSWDNHFIELNN